MHTHSNVQRPGAPPFVAGLVRYWHRGECWVAMTAFSFIALVVVYDVAAREVLGPLLRRAGGNANAVMVVGAAKMGVYALIVGAFSGIGIATATGAQLVPKVAFGWVPRAWGPTMDRLADALTALFLLGVAYYGAVFVNGSRVSGLLTSGGLEMPAWVIQAVIPVGFASAAVRYVLFALWPAVRPQPPEFQE